MGAYRKANIRELASAAYELDGRVVQGDLHRDEDGQWLVGSTPVNDWLSRNEGEDVVVVLLSMDDDRPLEKKVCRTCGREYVGYACPKCLEARRRLRGR